MTSSSSRVAPMVIFSFIICFLVKISALTEPRDVEALDDIMSRLRNPSVVIDMGWKIGGDPCGERWNGITCSNLSVIHIDLYGKELVGLLGGALSLLTHVKKLDLGSNQFYGGLPFGWPPGLTYLDISKNNLTGVLPINLARLQNLTSLYLNDNKLSGSVDVLCGLPLVDLNIERNEFSGFLPDKIKAIPHVLTEGNFFYKFETPPSSPNARRKSNKTDGTVIPKEALIIGGVVIVVIGILGFCCWYCWGGPGPGQAPHLNEVNLGNIPEHQIPPHLPVQEEQEEVACGPCTRSRRLKRNDPLLPGLD